MTAVLLIVSIICNVWFLFLLLYDRIMEMKLVRFFRNLVGLWRALDGKAGKQEAAKETPPEETPDIMGKSRFKMASTRTNAAIPAQEAAISEKALSCRRKTLLLTTETRKPLHARCKSRKTNSMKPSRVSHLPIWSSGKRSRRRKPRTNGGLRDTALTKSGKPSA